MFKEVVAEADEGGGNSTAADDFAVASEVDAVNKVALGGCEADEHEPARFGFGGFIEWVGSGDAGDADSVVTPGSASGTDGHFEGGLFGHGSLFDESPLFDSEAALFAVSGVGDVPGVEGI